MQQETGPQMSADADTRTDLPVIPVTDDDIRRMAETRNTTIKALRAVLKVRTGQPWSVTGGRGTSWGWITVDAPPARRDGYQITVEDGALLMVAFGMDHRRPGNLGIPASTAYRRVYLQRAHGVPRTFTAEQYWD